MQQRAELQVAQPLGREGEASRRPASRAGRRPGSVRRCSCRPPPRRRRARTRFPGTRRTARRASARARAVRDRRWPGRRAAGSARTGPTRACTAYRPTIRPTGVRAASIATTSRSSRSCCRRFGPAQRRLPQCGHQDVDGELGEQRRHEQRGHRPRRRHARRRRSGRAPGRARSSRCSSATHSRAAELRPLTSPAPWPARGQPDGERDVVGRRHDEQGNERQLRRHGEAAGRRRTRPGPRRRTRASRRRPPASRRPRDPAAARERTSRRRGRRPRARRSTTSLARRPARPRAGRSSSRMRCCAAKSGSRAIASWIGIADRLLERPTRRMFHPDRARRRADAWSCAETDSRRLHGSDHGRTE